LEISKIYFKMKYIRLFAFLAALFSATTLSRAGDLEWMTQEQWAALRKNAVIYNLSQTTTGILGVLGWVSCDTDGGGREDMREYYRLFPTEGKNPIWYFYDKDRDGSYSLPKGEIAFDIEEDKLNGNEVFKRPQKKNEKEPNPFRKAPFFPPNGQYGSS